MMNMLKVILVIKAFKAFYNFNSSCIIKNPSKPEHLGGSVG